MQNNSIELKFVPIGGSYHVELRSSIAGQPSLVKDIDLPTFDSRQYCNYQAACLKLYDRLRLGVRSVTVLTSEELARIRGELVDAANNVLGTHERWTQSPAFAEIAAEIDRLSENLQVTISTDDIDLRRQPWHASSLFPPNTEVIFSGRNAKKIDRETQPHPEKIRILVILGNDKGISEGVKQDRLAIEKYCKKDVESEIETLYQPTKAALIAALADPEGWDIVLFSGHSKTDEHNVGHIEINATESLTIAELKEVLKPAIERRIQIFIFNSCDGLGLAPELEKMNIDRLIVMREPIPDAVAQRFLKNFLRAFTRGARFDDAVKIARQQLVELEDDYPYASWLPIVIQNRLVSSSTWQELGKIGSPFKGLAAYTEDDAGNFYGREETIERYANLVAQVCLLPIIGASGSGKSSLVQAGLIPKLRQDPKCQWQILTMRPGLNPLAALTQAIAKVDRANLETIELDIDLKSDPHLLTQKLAQIRLPQHRLLLFIDQFEELFTQSDDEPTRQVFLKSLADAVSNAPNFVLVFTLRNDFLPTLQNDRQDNDFRQLLEQYSPQLVGSMNREQLRAAITKPVEQLGVEFEGGLVERLLQDVGTNEGSLPLLQLVLYLLWKNVQRRKLTHECYEQIGGKEGLRNVLVNLADNVYSGFAEQGKAKEFKQVFLRLVTIGDTNKQNTRRIATRQEIDTDNKANWQEIVEPLLKARLLKTDLNEQGKEIVEVIHETLIQSWQQLAIWIDKHRQELERIGEIEAAAIKWDRNTRAKEDLWGGKKLKEARKFSTAAERIFPLPQVADDFLVAGRRQSSKQQRWYIGWSMVLGLLLALLVWKFQSRQTAIAEASDLASDAKFQPQMDSLVAAIKAERILQGQQVSDPNVLDILHTAFDKFDKQNRLNGHQDSVNSVSFSPNGKTLASGSRDKTIKLWDLASGKEIRTLSGHQEGVNSVSFSPDGKTLASGSDDKSIKLWDLTSGKEPRTLSGHKKRVNSVSFSPDGKTLASVSLNNTIKLWNLSTGAESRTLSGDREPDWSLSYESDWLSFSQNPDSSVSFSPDGKTLASGSWNETIKLWDLATGKRLRTLSGHQSFVNSVSFSPDGKTLASGSADKTIKLWGSSNWNVDALMDRSCDWARAYLENNINVSQSDKHLCDGIGTKK